MRSVHMVMGTMQQEKIIIINVYVLNIGVPNFIKQTLIHMKHQRDTNTIVMGNLNTPLWQINKTKSTKKCHSWTKPSNKWTTCHLQSRPLNGRIHTLPGPYGAFSQIQHSVAHQARLHKWKSTKIMPCILSNHTAMKLEINVRKWQKLCKHTDTKQCPFK